MNMLVKTSSIKKTRYLKEYVNLSLWK